MKTIIQSTRIFLGLTLLTGIIYPLAMTGLANVLFPRQAQGSLVQINGKLAGSELLAQKFAGESYFWSRPSAADYATVASGASNKGPTSGDLVKSIAAQRTALGAEAPVDLLTASASGLDPHISPEAAKFQIPRIAAARHLPNEQLDALVDGLTEAPQLGFLGEPRVNVLRLNRELAANRK